MAKLTEYIVLREHEGDKFYKAGDTRTANAADVKHLVPKVLEEVGPSADPAPEKGPEPETKIITGSKAKGK